MQTTEATKSSPLYQRAKAVKARLVNLDKFDREPHYANCILAQEVVRLGDAGERH